MKLLITLATLGFATILSKPVENDLFDYSVQDEDCIENEVKPAQIEDDFFRANSDEFIDEDCEDVPEAMVLSDDLALEDISEAYVPEDSVNAPAYDEDYECEEEEEYSAPAIMKDEPIFPIEMNEEQEDCYDENGDENEDWSPADDGIDEGEFFDQEVLDYANAFSDQGLFQPVMDQEECEE